MSEPALAVGGTKVDFEGFGHGIIVPINPQSHLMYYLSCVNTLLKAKGEQTDRDMKKLCDYKHYQRLSESEVDQLILMCYLLSPDILLNKCLFICDELTQDYNNNFYEIKAVSNRFVITRDLLIGGERRTVQRIMACRAGWLDENWIKPMEHYKDRLQNITSGRPGGAIGQGAGGASGQRGGAGGGRGGRGGRGRSAGQSRPAQQGASNPRPRTTQSTTSTPAPSSSDDKKWCSVM